MEDIEIARNTKLNKISDKYKAKISNKVYKRLEKKENGKLILVTAINPTPLGEGKTTMAIGLADGLRRINKKSILALREPSLRTSVWNKRRSNRRRLFASCSNGRYKFTFYRRYTCNYIS